MAQAPVCNVKGVEVSGSPSLGVVQPIPRATDLASALKAIQALTNNFNALNKQIPPSPVIQGFTVKPSQSNQSDWIEDTGKRVTKKTKVENPDDPSQFVEIEQVSGYTMKNKKTGEIFKWSL